MPRTNPQKNISACLQVFDEIDTDGSGWIDMEEFVNFYRKLIGKRQSSKGQKELQHRRRMFEQMGIEQLEDLAASARLVDSQTALKNLQRKELVRMLSETVSIPLPPVRRRRGEFNLEETIPEEDKLEFDPIEILELGQIV